MSKFKTSRGKWEAGIVVNDDGEKWLGVVAGNRKIGERAITFLISREADVNDEDIANAKIIAASLEMRDALILSKEIILRYAQFNFGLMDGDDKNRVKMFDDKLKNIIERATGMTIDEAIKAYEAEHEQKQITSKAYRNTEGNDHR